MTPAASGLITQIAALDAVLAAHEGVIGDDFRRYRHHCYRVANLCAACLPDNSGAIERIGIAAAFHDLGIWTDRTFDYLEPSVSLVRVHLAQEGRPGSWEEEIVEAIRWHHKLTRYRGPAGPLVEAFRRADWIDVTGGMLAFGISRHFIRALYARWPSEGFHRLLVRLELRHLRSHPLNPLPVLRL